MEKLTDAHALRILREIDEVGESELSPKEEGKFIAAIMRFRDFQLELNEIAEDLMDTDKESKYTKMDEDAVDMAYEYIKDAFNALQEAKELLADIVLVKPGEDGEKHYFIPKELKND